ncbi:MAG: glycosyltransferase [Desulfobacterales bacterium]|nr:glycosyltransferase [Desulfobacterales bacterium]
MTLPLPDKAVTLSAIVSTYNDSRFIRGCLDDLLAQTIVDDMEIIVVDSGSREDEGRIVQELQSDHANIVYIRTEERETVYGAWNRGIRAARGRYLTNANTDDRHSSDALERMVNILEKYPEVALVYADAIITATPNEVLGRHTKTGVFHWNAWDRQALLEKGCFIGPQPVWRKAVHTEFGHFDDTLVSSGDYEFWLRISQLYDFYHLDMPLGLYLERGDSIEHSSTDIRREEDRRIVDLYRQAAAEGRVLRRASPAVPTDKTEPADSEAGAKDLYRQALAQNEQGDIAAACRQLEQLVAAYPEFSLALNDLGVLYYQSGHMDKALDAYRRSVQLEPDNLTFKKNLADFLCVEHQEIEAAVALYHEILAVQPDDLETLVALGQVCAMMNKPQDAIHFFQQALNLQPWNDDIRQRLAELNND